MKNLTKGHPKSENRSTLDLSSRSSVDSFRAAAKSFTARAAKSKRSAKMILIAEGIYAKSGELAKGYR